MVFPISNCTRFWPQFSHFLHSLSEFDSIYYWVFSLENNSESHINTPKFMDVECIFEANHFGTNNNNNNHHHHTIKTITKQKTCCENASLSHYWPASIICHWITTLFLCVCFVNWCKCVRGKKTNNNHNNKMTNNKRQNDVNDNANNHLKLLYFRLWTMCQKDDGKRFKKERQRQNDGKQQEK